jgi:hypothetical protein
LDLLHKLSERYTFTLLPTRSACWLIYWYAKSCVAVENGDSNLAF